MQLYQKDAKTVRFMSKRLFGSRGMRFFLWTIILFLSAGGSHKKGILILREAFVPDTGQVPLS